MPEADPGQEPFDDDRITRGVTTDDAHEAVSGPLSDQAAVERDAKEWADLWRAGEEYSVIFGDNIDPLPPLTISDLKNAAMTFPNNTGLGSDNVSPRALMRLPAEALAELVDLLHQAEKLGSWTNALALVMIVMLPKDDGGKRPIGLFPTLIRVWMRARAPIARKWEAKTARPELFGGRGMGAQRAAWIASFGAEAAAAGGNDHAASLLDLVKAFEMIPHKHIAAAAKKHG